MKMSKEAYSKLKEFVRPVMTPESRASCPHSAKRYRWDCVWKAVPRQFVIDLYNEEDLNDDHIDTALRSLVKELTGELR